MQRPEKLRRRRSYCSVSRRTAVTRFFFLLATKSPRQAPQKKEGDTKKNYGLPSSHPPRLTPPIIIIDERRRLESGTDGRKNAHTHTQINAPLCHTRSRLTTPHDSHIRPSSPLSTPHDCHKKRLFSLSHTLTSLPRS